jgi:hypothetical protein
LQLRVECTLFYPSRDGPYYVIGYGRQVGGRPHRFPHNNFSSVYRIFIKLWKEKNPIYFGVIRSKVKVTITLNRIFDNSYKPITNTAWVHARLCKLQQEMCASQNTPVYINYQTVKNSNYT